MKTWQKEDGTWVSYKPDVYVVGKDCAGNNILNTDSVVLLRKGKLKFGYSGGQLWQTFYTDTETRYKILLLKELEPKMHLIDPSICEGYEWNEFSFDSSNYDFMSYTKDSNKWEAIYKNKIKKDYYLVNFGDKMGDGFDHITLLSKERATSLL